MLYQDKNYIGVMTTFSVRSVLNHYTGDPLKVLQQNFSVKSSKFWNSQIYGNDRFNNAKQLL